MQMAEENTVRTQISLLGGMKSVPRPSRSYALRSGLVPSDLVSRTPKQSVVAYASISAADIENLTLFCLKHCSDPDTVVDVKGFLEELYLTESERGRLLDLISKAPNMNEVYRILNRFGQRSLSNRDEAKLKQEKWHQKVSRKEDRAVLREQEVRRREDDALVDQWQLLDRFETRKLDARMIHLCAVIRGKEDTKLALQEQAMSRLAGRHELESYLKPTLLVHKGYHAARDRALAYVETVEDLDTVCVQTLFDDVLKYESSLIHTTGQHGEASQGLRRVWMAEAAQLQGAAAMAHLSCARRIAARDAETTAAESAQWSAAAMWFEAQLATLEKLHSNSQHPSVAACRGYLETAQQKCCT